MHDGPPSWRLTYILLHFYMYIIYLLSRPSSVAKSIGRALYVFLHSLLLFTFYLNPQSPNYYYYYYYYFTPPHTPSFYNYYHYFIIVIIISVSLPYQCIFFIMLLGLFTLVSMVTCCSKCTASL